MRPSRKADNFTASCERIVGVYVSQRCGPPVPVTRIEHYFYSIDIFIMELAIYRPRAWNGELNVNNEAGREGTTNIPSCAVGGRNNEY
jgi:hypothetical protein